MNEQQLDRLTPFTKTIGMDFDFIPYYLRQTKQDSFEKKLRPILPSTMDLEDLRQIAILMYKIMSIDKVQNLWLVYRKAGEGELQATVQTNHHRPIKFCAKEIRSLVKSSSIQNHNEDDHHTVCLTFVNSCLRDLNSKSEQYRHGLNMKTSRLSGYNRSLQDTIEKFLQKHLEYFRKKIEQEISLVRYYYTDELLQQTFLKENPTNNQVSADFIFISTICILFSF